MLNQLKRIPRRIKNRFVAGGLILMYHRITDALPDPWGCCVSPENFAEHLELLRKEYQPVALSEFPGVISRSKFPLSGRRPVAVTFDDGYADNLLTALPLLRKYNIPATIFITTENINRQQEFWSDEMERILLQPGRLSAKASLTIARQHFEWDLGENAEYSEKDFKENLRWKAIESTTPTRRHALFRELYPLLQPLDDVSRDSIIGELRVQAGLKEAQRPTHRFVTISELRELAQSELIEIGAHSVTHPPLSRRSEKEQWTEIHSSRMQLGNIPDQPVDSFAYPYGDYDAVSVRQVVKAGFVRACTTKACAVRKSDDPFELPRVQVQNWSGKELKWWMSRWLYG
jgi:peptidoglycan/xylan/chitin deacetylase (PgdA/CDA1 family)